jgi:cadmium resistance protein CadD (predicted permease)
VKVILPLILIVAMSWIVFWIDPEESGIQISVAITTMLTLIAYRFAVGADLPKVSYLTRLDFFILSATILVFASLIEVIVTSTLAGQEKIALARNLDNWSRWLFPTIFSMVALITFTGQFALLELALYVSLLAGVLMLGWSWLRPSPNGFGPEHSRDSIKGVDCHYSDGGDLDGSI